MATLYQKLMSSNDNGTGSRAQQKHTDEYQ